MHAEAFDESAQIPKGAASSRCEPANPAGTETVGAESRAGGRYLDDFAVGQRFTSPTITVTAEDIKAFARQFDPQPFHVDEVAARSTPFQGLAASGLHTAAIAMRLLVETRLDIVCGIIGRGIDDVSWPQPVRPGDALTLEAVVAAVAPSRSKPDQGTIRLELTTLNQRGDVVQRGIANLYVPRRASRAAA